MRIRRIDEQQQRLLPARPQDHTVARRDRVLLIGKTAVGAFIELLTEARADVLSLVTFAAGTLPDRIAAVLAEIIAPGILIVRAGGFVEDKRIAVQLAPVGRVLACDA